MTAAQPPTAASPTLQLTRWTVTSGSNAQSRGAVVIEAGTHHWRASAEGNGAVDALFKAVDAALADVLEGHPRLVGYDVHALGRGTGGPGPRDRRDRAAGRRARAPARPGCTTGGRAARTSSPRRSRPTSRRSTSMLAEAHWAGAAEVAGKSRRATPETHGRRARARSRRDATTALPGSIASSRVIARRSRRWRLPRPRSRTFECARDRVLGAALRPSPADRTSSERDRCGSRTRASRGRSPRTRSCAGSRRPRRARCRRSGASSRAYATATADAGVVPVESSQLGTIRETLDLLYEFDLVIVGEVSVPVRLALLALPGERLETIRTVHSIAAALAQADEFLRAGSWTIQTTWNTAGAARQIAESRRARRRRRRVGARRGPVRARGHRGRHPDR